MCKKYKKRYYWKGKRVSKGEYLIAKSLESNKVKFEKEKTFPTCLSPKGNNLRFDFFLNDYNLLIEFQGDQHYKPISTKRSHKLSHARLAKHDNIKRDFCKRNNITLLEIPYSFIDNIDYIINKILYKEGQSLGDEAKTRRVFRF